ncbi:MAG: ribulose-phosphate 3-epimerase [Clostridia bacterium]|nr:ribulose-phosphate 3-epimerase [Clostridia bacterium]
MLRPAISPSLMCADIFRLGEIIDGFEKNSIELLHIDVMDGEFVPNFCLGTDYCRRLKAATDIPLDIHLMVSEPENKLEAFPFGEGDMVSVHYESVGSKNLAPSFEKIRKRGAKPFIAINPDTPTEAVSDWLEMTDGVLLMTVYPGFAGQSMVEGSLERITALRRLMDENGYSEKSIEVDGNVNYEKAPLMRRAGADIFVVGTSSILGPGDLTDNIRKMRSLLDEVTG